MNHWLTRLQFLWEEAPPPPEEAPLAGAERAAGVPAWLRRATHGAVTGAVGVTLMAQIIGVRLVAPVDASGGYVAQCTIGCKRDLLRCLDLCPRIVSGGKLIPNPAAAQACTTTFTTCVRGCIPDFGTHPKSKW